MLLINGFFINQFRLFQENIACLIICFMNELKVRDIKCMTKL